MFACVAGQLEEVFEAVIAGDSVGVGSVIDLWIIIITCNVSSGGTGSDTG